MLVLQPLQVHAEIAGLEFVLPPVVPFSADAPEGLVSEDGSTAFTVLPINATIKRVEAESVDVRSTDDDVIADVILGDAGKVAVTARKVTQGSAARRATATIPAVSISTMHAPVRCAKAALAGGSATRCGSGRSSRSAERSPRIP